MREIDYNKIKDLRYNDFLDWLRTFSAEDLNALEAEFKANLPVEGFAAYQRWMEILDSPSKIDKLLQGQLKNEREADIMEVAVGDDEEAFWTALIRENVAQLNSSTSSPQEVARLTQNLGIFRDKLHDIRSRKPKKGTILEKVLEKSNTPKKVVPKTASNRGKTTKTTTAPSKTKKPTQAKTEGNKGKSEK